MTTHLSFRIRTEQSEECSATGSELALVEHSIDSISIAGESISLHIQQLQKQEEDAPSRSKNTVSSRSLSYICIQDEEVQQRKHSKSMKNKIKPAISLEAVPVQILTQLLSYHRCPNLAKNQIYNRAYGAMFGFLIGDSMGSHVINKPYSQQQILHAVAMKGGGVMNLKPGQGTDEWQICLSLCEGLQVCGKSYDSNIIAGKYLEWIDSNPYDLPVLMGISFSQINKSRYKNAFVNYSTLGEQLRTGSLRNIKYESVLGLVRLIPLVIWGLKLQQYEFNYVIKEQMKLITPNQFVVESSIIFANLLKCIINTGDHRFAYHQASQNVHRFGSQKMIDLWKCIEQNRDLFMSNTTANNLKFPFAFAINEMLDIDEHKDLKKYFIETAIRVLSKGFNADTNCSITLGVIGAVIGYSNIPSYFRSKVVNAESGCSFRVRKREYSSFKILDAVEKLLKMGPTQLAE